MFYLENPCNLSKLHVWAVSLCPVYEGQYDHFSRKKSQEGMCRDNHCHNVLLHGVWYKTCSLFMYFCLLQSHWIAFLYLLNGWLFLSTSSLVLRCQTTNVGLLWVEQNLILNSLKFRSRIYKPSYIRPASNERRRSYTKIPRNRSMNLKRDFNQLNAARL